MKLTRIIPLCIALCISPHVFSEDLGPYAAARKCTYVALEPGTYFEIFGHSNTTYKVSNLAGLSKADVFTLSYFSQYPDEDKTLDAIVNSIKNKIPFVSNQFTNDAVRKLHSLHGGDLTAINDRRRSLEVAIKTNLQKPKDVWKAGLLIHAYGDTFAHTKGGYASSDEKAFGPAVGHLFHSILGENPDQVTKDINKVKYLAYVNSLFNLLRVEDARINDFDQFINIVKNTTCTDDNCLKFEVLKMKDFKQILKFDSCMNANMKRLSKEEVQEVMDQIN